MKNDIKITKTFFHTNLLYYVKNQLYSFFFWINKLSNKFFNIKKFITIKNLISIKKIIMIMNLVIKFIIKNLLILKILLILLFINIF